MASVLVESDPDGELVAIRADYRMAPAWKKRYVQALAGARLDAATGRYRAPLDRMTGILARLREARMPVRVSAEVVARLEHLTAAAWLDREAADERLSQADAYLRKKGARLRDYQRQGVAWLLERKSALLGDDMGLGKSLQTLAAVPVDARVLVVCPALVKGNWARETKCWRSGLKTTVLEGREAFRWPNRGEVVVVNFDVLPRAHADACPRKRAEPGYVCPGCHPHVLREHLPGKCPAKRPWTSFCKPGHTFEPGCFAKEAPPGVVLVVDEAHLVKNERAYRSEATRMLSAAVLDKEGGRAWYLTGTPVLNQPLEMWNILVSAGLAAEAFGVEESGEPDFKTFVRVFGGRPKYYERFDPETKKIVRRKAGWEWATDPGPEAADRLSRVMLRRRKVDVLEDLPPKTVRLFPVEIDDATLAKCDELLEAAGERGLRDAKDLLALQKVKFELVARVRSALAGAKIPALLGLVEEHEENGVPLVVFSARMSNESQRQSKSQKENG